MEFYGFFSPQAHLFQFPGVKLKYIPLKRMGLLIIPIKMLFVFVTQQPYGPIVASIFGNDLINFV